MGHTLGLLVKILADCRGHLTCVLLCGTVNFVRQLLRPTVHKSTSGQSLVGFVTNEQHSFYRSKVGGKVCHQLRFIGVEWQIFQEQLRLQRITLVESLLLLLIDIALYLYLIFIIVIIGCKVKLDLVMCISVIFIICVSCLPASFTFANILLFTWNFFTIATLVYIIAIITCVSCTLWRVIHFSNGHTSVRLFLLLLWLHLFADTLLCLFLSQRWRRRFTFYCTFSHFTKKKKKM